MKGMRTAPRQFAGWFAAAARRAMRVTGVGALLVWAAAGCGDYSNEDLEFMSAIPQRGDVAIEVPRQSSLTSAASAEGWRTTLDVTRSLNGVADAFLSLIEKVRSHYPTTRNGNERIWGPFPAKDSPGWQMEFRMLKVSAASDLDPSMARFQYELVMLPPPDVVLVSGAGETRIIGGSFDAAGGVRVGVGQLRVTLDVARAAGVPFPGLDRLRELTIVYNTRDLPRQVTMTILNVTPLDPRTEAVSATYVYQRAESGDGAMTFSFVRDSVPGAAGVETLMVESRWLGSGPGRSDVSVTGGDSGGLATSLECWNDRFESTFKTQSWNVSATTGNADQCIPRL